jgi:polyhydroxybutyrate depolymerase
MPRARAIAVASKCLAFILVSCCVCVGAAMNDAASPGVAAAGSHSVTIHVGNRDRRYILHVPPENEGRKPLPLVLVFHGGGGTPEYAQRESKFSELADRKGFLVAYPEGIGKSWNDGREAASITAQRENVDDVAFVAALIDQVSKDHGVDAKRVFSTGISNGGIFSHYLAVHLARRIAAIAPVAGGIAEAVAPGFKPEAPVSVLILQGTQDPLVPYGGGEITLPFGITRGRIIDTQATVQLWVERNGDKRQPVEEDIANDDPVGGCPTKRFTWSGGADGVEVILYRLEGGGHTWPGGMQYLPKSVIGKVCKNVNATEVIWEFFAKHPKQ